MTATLRTLTQAPETSATFQRADFPEFAHAPLLQAHWALVGTTTISRLFFSDIGAGTFANEVGMDTDPALTVGDNHALTTCIIVDSSTAYPAVHEVVAQRAAQIAGLKLPKHPWITLLAYRDDDERRISRY